MGIPENVALQVQVALVVIVGFPNPYNASFEPLDAYPGPSHASLKPPPNQHDNQTSKCDDRPHSYPDPLSPDRIVLEMIYEPSRDHQKAHAVKSSEDARCEGDIMWLGQNSAPVSEQRCIMLYLKR